MSRHKYYLDINDRNTYRVMNQTGVKQCVLPNPTKHEACWDAILSQHGEVYLSLCSELTTSEYAKLAQYDPDSNTVTELHYAKEYIFSNERYIRDSKFHTSMSWLPDGRLIMLTHTTDKAPAHPAWIPQGYYGHPFEGYPGSSLMTYDPATGKMENWGIPVHRETIYGAVYDKINNIYYGIGFLRGHLYGIDLKDRSVKDYGQVTERASYRMVVGSDDNIYFTTRNGLLQRINVRTRQVENLEKQLPYEVVEGRAFRPYMTYGVNGPDGKLYMGGMYDTRLNAFDPATGELTVIGDYLNADNFSNGIRANSYIGAMAFDKENVLYYAVCNHRWDLQEDWLLPAVLMRWDFLRGGEPEYLGLLGTKERVTTTVCNMLMDLQRDTVYMVGGNHATDAPHVIAIDLSGFRNHASQLGDIATDALIIPGNEAYKAHGEARARLNQEAARNTTPFTHGKVVPVPLWRILEDPENSCVTALSLEGEYVAAICGKDCFRKVLLDWQGNILSITPCEEPAKRQALSFPEDRLPTYPGRTYKRIADKAVAISGGRQLVATADGLLAIVKDNRVYALGPGWINGAVHDLAVTDDGQTVYGVAGDSDDIGVVFSYNDDEGLRWRGYVMTNTVEYGNHSSPNLLAICVSGDGERIAIGADGRMGYVYLYSKPAQ